MKRATKLVQKADIAKLLSTPTWTVHSVFDNARPPRHVPTEAELLHLSEMAGLKPPSDVMKSAFYKQLKFVETIRDCDTEGIEPLERLVAPVVVPDPDSHRSVESVIKKTDEEEATWNPVSHAAEREGSYYVVKGLNTRAN